MGNRHHRDVVVSQVQVGAVDVVGQERTTGAARVPAFGEHEVIDDQLAVVAEQVDQFQIAVWALEAVVLVDLHPGQGAAFGAEFVAFFGEGFFVGQVLLAGASHSSRDTTG